MANMRQHWIILGYIGYAVGLFALFTYVNFPGQQVRTHIITALRQVGLEQVRIGGVEPLLPMGLSMNEVSVGHDLGGQTVELARFPTLHVWLRSWLPFGNARRIGFEAGLYGGNVLGAVEWKRNGKPPSLGVRADLRGIRPASHPLIARWGPQSFEGKLAGSLTLELVDHQWRNNSGRLMLQSEGGNFAGFEIKGMRLPALVYEQLTGELFLSQQSLILKDFLLRGRDWQLEMQGHISLQEIARQSPIELTLRVRASEALEQQLGMIGMMLKQRRDRRGFAAFKISGTLENPSLML